MATREQWHKRLDDLLTKLASPYRSVEKLLDIVQDAQGILDDIMNLECKVTVLEGQKEE